MGSKNTSSLGYNVLDIVTFHLYYIRFLRKLESPVGIVNRLVSNMFILVQDWDPLHEHSPTFLAPGTGFMEDSFAMDGGGCWGGRWLGGGSGGNASDGERQMNLCSLTCHSPPAVWPSS